LAYNQIGKNTDFSKLSETVITMFSDQAVKQLASAFNSDGTNIPKYDSWKVNE